MFLPQPPFLIIFCNFLQELFLQVFWALQEFINKFRVGIELSLESWFGFSSYPGNVGRQDGYKNLAISWGMRGAYELFSRLNHKPGSYTLVILKFLSMQKVSIPAYHNRLQRSTIILKLIIHTYIHTLFISEANCINK